MWSIVNFREDNSVEVVPSKWVTKYKCVWPLNNPKKYIESQSDPDTTAFNWFKARTLLSNIGKYSHLNYLTYLPNIITNRCIRCLNLKI